MRPLVLTMTAFGPFATTQTIDFRQIDHGLFLIAGETGAGKTAIFDAMVYALYGKKSAKETEDRTAALRSNFAARDVCPTVRFSFLHSHKRYSVTRTLPYERPKRRGQGTVSEQATATLTLPDGRIIDGVVKVQEALDRCLGLSLAQFRHLVLLPQGECAKLLNASSREREDILRCLFQTDYASRVARSLADREAKQREAFRTLTRDVCDLAKRLPVPADAPWSETWRRACDAGQADVLLGLEEALVALTRTHEDETQAARQALDAAQRDLDEATRAAERAKVTAERRAARVAAEAALHQVLSLRDAMKRHKRTLNAARRAATVHDLDDALERAVRDETRADDERLTLEREAQALAEEARTIADTARTVAMWERDEGAKRALQMHRLAQQEALTQLDALAATRRTVEAEHAACQAAWTRLQDAETALRRLDGTAQVLAHADLTMEARRQHVTVARQTALAFMKELHEVRQLDAQSHKASRACKVASDAHNQAIAQRIEAETLYLRGQAGVMAAALSEGKPCPVCGSTHHPHPAVDTAVSRDALDDAEREVDRCSRHLIAVESDYAGISAAYDSARRRVDTRIATTPWRGLSLDQMSTKMKAETDTLSALVTAVDRLQAVVMRVLASLERQRQSLNVCLSQRGVTAQALDKSARALADIDGQMRAPQARLAGDAAAVVRASLEATTAWLDALDDARTRLRRDESQFAARHSALSARLETARARQDEARANRRAAEGALDDGLKTRGFVDRASYEQARLCDDEHQAYERRWRQYKDKVRQARSTVNALRDVGDEVTPPTASWSETIATLRARRDAERERLRHSDVMMVRWQETLTALIAHRDAYAKAAHQVSEAKQLADVAGGTLPGTSKRSFESFVQTDWFVRVLSVANRRLETMSDGRYRLCLRPPDHSLSRRSGLDLDVFDAYNNRRREAESLSGGETFVAALALALGLSDVVQETTGGLDVDCLFVDEGFGTLDPGALRRALGILERLAGDTRLIGVISHVAMLKEVLVRQLNVTKTRSGSHVAWNDEVILASR